ncbi:ATP-binding protein [Streptomyces sp. NPDC048111]|uniref:ATP-binding protein n=1 Tax=Streptomyces sp. NPDC048111 TaxID=3365500 RepID=UPI0037137B5E
MTSTDGTMVGREHEHAVLEGLVTASGGQALVLRGDTGVGKSALLGHTAALAAVQHHTVLRATGVEAESELPFAGLHQFLRPLLPHIDDLAHSRRRVFDVVFGRSEGPAPSTMTLGIAVLDMLSFAARRKPLLVALDDGHWFDTSSAQVCGFVGRRLTGSAVKLVVALRSDVPSGFDTAALPQLPVPALSKEASEQLLDLRSPGLDHRTRRLVLDEAGGNPLALLELPPHVLDRGRAPADAPTSPGYSGIPLPVRLQHVYGARIETLGASVRTELLRGALDGVGAGTATGHVHDPRYRMTDVEEAAARGLLDLDPASGDFVFRHPLVRSTVVQMATANQRRAAHAVLARVHREDVERRAVHLAASTVDPDEQVAAALEAAAESAILRGGSLAAVSWLTRAAELSEHHAERSRRLGSAAFTAGHAGLLDRAQQLARHEGESGTSRSPAAVVASAYVDLYEDGDVRSTHRRVMAAIELVRDSGAAAQQHEVLTRLVNLLLAISQYASDATAWEHTHALLDSLGALVAPNSRVYQDAWGDVVLRGADVRERVDHALADPGALEPWEITRLGVAAYHVDTLGRYRPHLLRIVDREVATGAVASGMTMLHLIMLDQTAAGEWAQAEATGLRSLELTTSHRYALFAQQTRAYLGLLAAVRGRIADAREYQAAVETWARPRGVGFLTQLADAIGTAAALTEGDHEAAYFHAIGITAPGAFTPYAHQAPRTLLDLVEAALRTGRTEQARRHALAAQRAGLTALSPRLALLTCGALAMTAPDTAEAQALYQQVEAHPAAPLFPFEVARIRLAHGIRLHHTQGRAAARPVLARAAETFAHLGAATWAQRARGEFGGTGSSVRAVAAPASTLTWQERRIAELAAAGLTNKAIGARMNLSPRTVGSHLYRVFPKLGITSRAALRDALGRLSDDADG